MRHAQMALSTVVTILILLVVAVLIFFSLNRGYSAVTEMFECDYCAPSCAVTQNGVPAGSDRFVGDSYCEDSTWNIGHLTESVRDRWFNGEEDTYRGDGTDGKALSCCSLRAEEVPDSYLSKDKRAGATEDIEAQGDIALPRVRAYFGDEVRPIRNGENIDVVSNQEYAYEIELYQIDEDFAIADYYCDLRLLNRFNDDLLAREGNQISPVLSGEDANQKITSAKCNELFSEEGVVEDITVLVPSEYEGESLTFQVLITKSPNTQETEEGKVRYNPETDVLYRNTFKVINPIQFDYDTGWVREQTLSVSCKGITCSRFFWKKGVCQPGDGESGEGFEQTRYSSQGTGFFTVNQKLLGNNKVGEINICVIGETAGKNYTKTTPRSIGIDADAPSVKGVFNPLKMQTNITCTESGQSGCAPRIGYHYIRRAVDFVGAAFTNDDASFCPDDLREYASIPARQTGDNSFSATVPFTGGQDFMIMCVMGEDAAGNFAKDIVFVYNSYNILMTVVNSQLEEGGAGTGYHGYNYG